MRLVFSRKKVRKKESPARGEVPFRGSASPSYPASSERGCGRCSRRRTATASATTTTATGGRESRGTFPKPRRRHGDSPTPQVVPGLRIALRWALPVTRALLAGLPPARTDRGRKRRGDKTNGFAEAARSRPESRCRLLRPLAFPLPPKGGLRGSKRRGSPSPRLQRPLPAACSTSKR